MNVPAIVLMTIAVLISLYLNWRTIAEDK